MEMKTLVLLLSVCMLGSSEGGNPGSDWDRYNGHWYYHSTQKLNWIGAQPTWIGATDLAEEGVWRSITTGENVPFTRWSTNNPDNDKGNQNCGTLNWSANGYWDDDTCSKQFTFICEVVG